MKQKIREALKFYDRVISKRIQCYDAILNLTTNLIVKHPGKELVVVDLGIGTGVLEEKIFARRSDIRLIGYDYSQEMLDFSAEKLKHFSGKTKFIQADLSKQLGLIDVQCDIVVSNLLFHSLPRDAKISLIENISASLRPGGVFILGDKFNSKSELVNSIEALAIDEWRKETKKGWGAEDHTKYATIWNLQKDSEEYLFTVDDHKQWLQHNLFETVECLYKVYAYGLLYAVQRGKENDDRGSNRKGEKNQSEESRPPVSS